MGCKNINKLPKYEFFISENSMFCKMIGNIQPSCFCVAGVLVDWIEMGFAIFHGSDHREDALLPLALHAKDSSYLDLLLMLVYLYAVFS